MGLNTKSTPRREYRRKAAAFGGSCAAMSAVVAVSSTRGHAAIAFICIAVQIILLALAIRFLMLAKQAS